MAAVITGDYRSDRRIVFLTADDATVNASTTLITSLLSIPCKEAGASYWFEAFLVFTSGTTPDVKLGLTAPTSWTADWGLEVQQGDVAVATTGPTALAVTDTATLGGAGATTRSIAVARGTLVGDGTNTGAFAIQYAQATSNASNTILRAGSCLRLYKVT